jgi:signal transduction histidine kinase
MLGHKIKKNGVRIVEDFDESIPPAPMFVSEVNQVWTNVIDNALDALNGNPNPQITIKTLKDGDYLTVYITDNGVGIPPDIIDRIWEPFFTTKELGKGTGLGLELVYQIMARHGGEAHVSSKPGETTFSFCFPLGEA